MAGELLLGLAGLVQPGYQTPQARRHLEAIAEYLTERSPAASRFVGQRIRETMRLLTDFPMIGHEGALQGTRHLSWRATATGSGKP